MERLHFPPNVGIVDCQNILVVSRHGKDNPTLTVDLDQPLLESSYPEIVNFGDEVAKYFRNIRGYTGIEICTSQKKRAFQSSQFLRQTFELWGIPVDIQVEDGIGEFYQGHFSISSDHRTGEPCLSLLIAWNIFIERLQIGDIFYRFGEPQSCLEGQECFFPQLQGLFQEYGDSQSSFSCRLYRFLIELLENSSGKLKLLMTHQVIISRIQRIISSVTSWNVVKTKKPGDFVRFHERTGKRIDIDHAHGVVLPILEGKEISTILNTELVYLENNLVQALDY